MRGLQYLKCLAKTLKIELHTMWFAVRHSDTPLLAKLVLFGIIIYAITPIDLIPDFIPVLGMIDDVLIIIFGLWIARRLIPKEVLLDCRKKAFEHDKKGGFLNRLLKS